MKGTTKNRQALNHTARDLKIFEKLSAAGWLSSSQIRDYFFPGKTMNAVCKRLRKLVNEKYVAIVRTSSTETAIYRLAKRGKLVLTARTRSDEENVNVPTQLPRKLRHFMAVNDLRLYFERMTDAPGVELLYFFSERELCRYYQNFPGAP